MDTPPRAFELRDSELPDVPWTVVDAVAVFLVGMVLASVVGQALPSVLDPTLARGIFFPLTLVLLVAAAVLYVRLRYPGRTRDLLGGVRIRGRHLLVGLGFGVVAFLFINLGFSLLMQLVVELTGGELPEVQQDLREAAADPQIGLLVIVSAVLVAPIAEELYFRGMLFQALRTKLGRWPGIGMSGFLFGAAHLFGVGGGITGAMYSLLVLSSFGMFLAWAMDRSGSVAVPVVMHIVFNAATLVGILLVGS